MTDNVKKLPAPAEPMTPVERAIAQGASIDVIEKVMAMQERFEANKAKRAYNAAMAAFKQHPPEVLKTIEVGFDSRRTGDRTSYKHEDLAVMLAAVDPALAAHGLWVRFKIASDTPPLAGVTVTCVVGHADGHSEEPASLHGAPDTTGNKNSIQAIGSTVSYLQRYTLKAALGMAAARDDDGVRSGAKLLGAEQVAKIKAALEIGDIDVDRFLEQVNVSLGKGETAASSVEEIPPVKYDSALRWIERAVSEGKYKRKGSK